MPERRGFRFALEVLFLAALAAALGFARLRPLAVAGIMLLGWLLVALLEWVTWRGEAHYGRGLPPALLRAADVVARSRCRSSSHGRATRLSSATTTTRRPGSRRRRSGRSCSAPGPSRA